MPKMCGSTDGMHHANGGIVRQRSREGPEERKADNVSARQ